MYSKLLFVFITFYSLFANAECVEDKFTAEQWQILTTAYQLGEPTDLGYTLAAISWQESFVGKKVVRMSPHDGDKGSYGVGHVQLSTAQEHLGITDHWEALADLAPYMIRDDVFSLKLSLSILHKNQKSVKGWKNLVRSYNGGVGGIDSIATEVYYNRVKEKVVYLKNCLEV